jgi:endonuclease III-like uncharacterized protein
MDIAKRLAATDQTSATLQRDVWVSMWRLATLASAAVSWQQVVESMENMKRSGVLLPADIRYLDEARHKAGMRPEK